MKIRRLLLFVLFALGLFLAWRFLPEFGGRQNPAKVAEGKKAVPVTMVNAESRDVPIWLAGLGTAEAYQKVTVRPRVSGMLDEINFIEGQTVKEGDVLARIDPRPYASQLAQAEAKVAQTVAQLANARQELERTSNLVKTGAVSRQLLDQLTANVAQIVAQQQADTAAEDAARLDLDFATVKAPITGRTGLRMIDKGNLVTASQTGGLVVISQFQPIAVVFTLAQNNLPALRQRMSASREPIVIQALSDDGKLLAEGKLDLIDNEIDASSGTLKLKAIFPNTDQSLWPGQFLTARVLVETRKQAVVVPTQVITAGLDGPFVYLVKSGETVEPRNVKPGPQVDDITVIEAGLQVGDPVVLDGQSKLQPGARVAIQPNKL